MKKTFRLTLLICLVLVASVLLFSACNPDTNTQTTPDASVITTPTTTEHSHVWTDWISVKEVKCEETGLLQRYCTDCHYTESQPIDALGHTEVIDAAVDATCKSTGLTQGSHCATCGTVLVKQETVGIGSHNMVNGVCTVCGEGSTSKLEYDITIWVSERYGVAEQFKQQIQAFMNANPGIVINLKIECVTEADAGHRVLADVASAPDIYCFAQDQLARLVQANALLPLESSIATNIVANNDKSSVAAATMNNIVYAYPMTSDNGYYMYYDTSIITPEEAESLEALIAACEKSGKKFRFALEDAWYTASFFFATGCESTWFTDENGNFVTVKDTFNSANGLIAMRGMQMLAQSSCYDSDSNIFTDAGVIVTGIWNRYAAESHFGANLGATDLPSFTVDGTTYHLGSYSGHKLIGVKPQDDPQKEAVLSLLAQFLTGEECQLQRYNEFDWVPSNLAAQQSTTVQANPSIVALTKQSEFAIPQGNIAGVFWDNARFLGEATKKANSIDELQKALDDYSAAINKSFIVTKGTYTVIGTVNGTMWDTDFEMTEDPESIWTSVEIFDLKVGDEFKVRLDYNWNISYGNNTDNADPYNSYRGNYTVKKAGSYYIQIVVNQNGTAVINLIPAN